ncbi:hypothetical protein MNBD_GAMMA01-2066 [hydrothermal vent metagenome]|uniref:Uncharacterized protein n=1 Tax=hydrothermal vent metagenome TaxID=652676 RepID=A0A3B0VLH8_9ZZZZ
MSIEIPKYTVQRIAPRPSVLKKTVVPLLMALSFVVGFFSSYFYVDDSIKSLRTRNAVLEDLNNDSQNKIAQQQVKLSLLKAEKKIKTEAVIQLQNDYKKLLDIQNDLKSDINFYERLLVPNTKNKGLRVFEAQVQRHTEDTFLLKLTLVQKIERAQLASGAYQIDLIGTLNNKSKTIKINKKDDSSFKFRYFYRVSLVFSLPDGFKPEQLVVKLLPKNKKTKAVEYTANWQSLIK